MNKNYLLSLVLYFLSIVIQDSFGTIYYVSPTGNDNNNGTSESTPWRTLDHVNSYGQSPGFAAGSIINFEGGKTFEATNKTYGAALFCWNSGTSSSPIVFTTYGGGGQRATIKSDTMGILCSNKQYVEFRNLYISGYFNPFSPGGATFL